MANFAYLRVSTSQQDTDNQKLSVLDYCNRHQLADMHYIEDTSSGKKRWQDRAIGQILEKATSGDKIVTAEISRLGRSTLQVLEILETATQKKVSIHIAKNNMVIDGSMQSTITATILGLAAQIERELISARTIEALAKKKSEGMKLGRPKGKAKTLKLDEHEILIKDYLAKGVSKTSLAKIIGCAPATLHSWVKRRKYRCEPH